MKALSSLLAAVAVVAMVHAEDISYPYQFAAGTAAVAGPSVTLKEGDKLKLAFVSNPGVTLECSLSGKTINVPGTIVGPTGTGEVMNPIVIAGPATVTVKTGGTGYGTGYSGIVTLSISRAGTSGEPVAVPQEAGSKFQVILESSSDLQNWIPMNPGEYNGDEVRRFFRTRIVKTEPQ